MKNISSKNNQQGVVLVFTAIGLTLFMGMAGLALDLSHAELNKTRLQNAVDTAALAGANVLNDQLGALTGTPTSAQITAAKADAQTKIINVFSANTGTGINSQLNQTIPALTNSNIAFSNTLFGSDTGTPLYVRVTSPTVGYPSWFMQVWGQTTKNVNTSAVAGVSPQATCVEDLVPIMLCAKPSSARGVGSGGNEGTWGYNYNERMKLDAKASGTDPAGNFMFLDSGCTSNSADCLRDQLAGAGNVPELCSGSTAGATAGTNPGNMMGPTAEGLNTRFGIYDANYRNDAVAQGKFKPDTNVTCYDLPLSSATSYSSYESGATGIDDPNGSNSNLHCNVHKPDATPGLGGNKRRVLALPIADCDGTHGGIPVGPGNTNVSILDIGCVFLDVPADRPGDAKYCSDSPTSNAIPLCDSTQKDISARFIRSGCDITGFSGNHVNTTFALKTVQLYKNPGSNDS